MKIPAIFAAGILAAFFLAVAPVAQAQVFFPQPVGGSEQNFDESAGSAQIEIDAVGALTADTTVNYVIESGNSPTIADATLTGPGADINDPNGGTIIIPQTATLPYTLSITIIDDIMSEPREEFSVRLTSVSHGSVDSFDFATGVFINANDNQPTFGIAVDDADTAEGQTAVFTVTLGGTAPDSGAVSVDWSVGGAGITAGDYTVSGAGSGNRGTLSFTALGSRMLNFAIAADGVTEEAEMLTVTLSNASGGSVIGTASATTTIAASDQPHAHSFVFTSPAASITEGTATATTYTVTRTGPAIADGSTLTVTWAYAAATPAPVAADFHNDTLPAGGTLEFTGSETSETFTVRTKEDMLNEAGERFTLTLSIASAHEAAANAEGGAGVPPAHTVTITDDDPITATVTGSASVNEDATVTTGVTVTLTGGTSTEAVDITYANADATGTLSIPAGMSSGMLSLTAVDDDVSEGSEMLSLVAGDFTATSAGVVNVAVSGAPTLTINADSDDNITVTVAAPASANTGQTAEFTVTMSNASAAAVTVDFTVALTVDGSAVTLPAGSVTPASQLSIPAGRTSGTISVAIPADVNVAESGSLAVTLTSATAASGGGMAGLAMAQTTATVAVTSDDPAAREARLEAPVASAGRGVGQLASQAVAGRLAAAVSGAAGANSLTIAGRDITAGAEVLAAQFLASGYATGDREISADELLRQSGFNLAAGDGGRGFNFWGGGDFVSAEGKHDGVDYDGDTSAFTLGIDTGWKDGLIGVAVSRSDGDVDFTVTADNTEHTLETEVTSFHPYLTRRLGRSQLWLTAGHGSGDAEIKEPNDVVIKTDLTVTTAAFGITHARGDLFTGGLSALYSRAKLDAVTTGRRLPATAADSLRVVADAEVGWSLGAWSPFLSFALRHDSGDGDTGGAFDLGGGVEYRTPTVLVRLAGSGHIQGQAADEQRATLTVRKSTGDFDLSLNLGADDDGVDTARLLTGEWRF